MRQHFFGRNLLSRTILFLVSLQLSFLLGCRSINSNPAISEEINPPTQTAVSANERSYGSASLYNTLRPNPNIRFSRLSLEQGLSQSSIYGLVQDDRGFIWIGTEDGLNRYDGNQFKIFKPVRNDQNSLSDGFVQVMLKDRDGTIWIGTNSGGLEHFDPLTEHFTHFPHKPDDANSISSDDVLALFQDQKGAIWIGTHGGGLNKLEFLDGGRIGTETAVKITRYHHDDRDETSLSHNVVQAISQDANGQLWIGTGNGLNRFDEKEQLFHRYYHDPENPNSLSHDNVWSIYLDDQGALWIGTEGGLNRLNPVAGLFKRFLHDPTDRNSLDHDHVRAILEDKNGLLWIGTEGGLNRFDRRSDRFYRYNHDPADPFSLNGGSIRTLFEDQLGVLWVGALGSGLNLAHPGRDQFTYYRNKPTDPHSLSNNVVFGICEDKNGVIWLGTNGGLNRFDRQTGQFTAYQNDPITRNSLINDHVWATFVDDEGLLWLGTEGGLDKFNPYTGIFTHYQHDPADETSLGHNQIWGIYQDSEGVIWIGTEAGLDRFDPTTETFKHFGHDPANPTSLSGHTAIVIYEDSENVLWVGTFSGGISRFDRRQETFTRFQHDPDDPTSLSHDAVMAFYEDKLGGFWVGTYGGGLNFFDRQSGKFRHFRKEEGLPSDVVYSIVEDDSGQFWLSTNHGLSRFDPRTETFENYDYRDGLQSNEFNLNSHLMSESGELFFGGINGLNTFFPATIHAIGAPPPIALISLSQKGTEVELPAYKATRTLEIQWPDNGFDFEFAVLSYIEPEKNQYAYMLEGFDKDWNAAGSNRFGRYTNLPGGDYALRLKGAGADGLWNEVGTSLAISVVPPFWTAWWFISSLIAALAVVGYGGYRWRVNRLKAQSLELDRQINERTRELTALYTITTVVSSSLDLEKTLAAALAKTLESLDGDAGGIHLWDSSKDFLRLNTHQGLNEDCVENLNRLSPQGSFLAPVVQNEKALLHQDLFMEQADTAVTLCDQGFRWLAAAPLIARGNVLGTLCIISHKQDDFSERSLELLGSIANQIGVAVENGYFYQAERLRAEQFQLINDVGQRFTSILDIGLVLNQVVELIQKTFGYYHVAIGLIEEDEVVYRVGFGPLWDDPSFDFHPARLKVGDEGLSGWVAGTGQPVLVPDVKEDPRYIWMHNSKTRSELIVPITVKKHVIGVLDIQSDSLDNFDETDLAVMQALANQAGIAIENARLYEQAQQLAVVEERNRLARDLHDSVTQSVYSLTLLAEAGQRMIKAGDTLQVAANQQRLGEIAQQALQEMRLLVYELRPFDLKAIGLAAALEQRLEVVERRAGVEARLLIQEDLLLSKEIEESLYRITQEALNNALKHANATAVSVSITSLAGAVLLEVKDNGRGFETELVGSQGGLGLLTMQERAAQVNGRLRIVSSPGEGTTICAELPKQVEESVGTSPKKQKLDEG